MLYCAQVMMSEETAVSEVMPWEEKFVEETIVYPGVMKGAAVPQTAAAKIDWATLESGPDKLKGSETCCTPIDVPPVATLSFLAAAARACDDSENASRLERMADRHLVRRDGFFYLDVGRDWRIGASANRIISLTESNGFRFRDMLRKNKF